MPENIELSLPTKSLLLSEIVQQPELWPTTLKRVQAARRPGHLEERPVLLTGAGTSAYAASAIADAWPGARAVPTTDLLLQSAAEMRALLPAFGDRGLLISLARSGESPESTAVVEKVQKHFPPVEHLAIVCNAEGRLARTPGVEVVCLDPRTNDRSLAMTGSFSNLVLGGLCLLHSRQIGQELPAICGRVERSLLDLNGAAEQIARSCKDRVVLLTSAMQPLAREGALKIVELTAGRVMATAETFLGFRHGPVGLLREDTPVVCFLSSDPQKRLYEEDLLADLREKGLGRLVVLGDHGPSMSKHDWRIPASAPLLPDPLRTPFEIPFIQLLAYHLSVNAGVDPDNPSPTGAITRVVRAFRIHEESTFAVEAGDFSPAK